MELSTLRDLFALQLEASELNRSISDVGQVLAEMDDMRCLESPAPDIMSRTSVHEPFATGITAIDAMIPIGRGQRELIIGDRQPGKSTIAIDAIINQNDCLCVYVAIGQKASTVAQIAHTLGQHNSLATTVLVMSGAAEPATLQFVAPYTGATVAEHFMYLGKATATIYDDLTKHAQGYREIAFFFCVDHPLVKPTPAMCSICTPACWNGPPSFWRKVSWTPRPIVAGHSVVRIGPQCVRADVSRGPSRVLSGGSSALFAGRAVGSGASEPFLPEHARGWPRSNCESVSNAIAALQ